ncbi:hypothetical protein [Streptomyces sp. NPDC057854]|uniref:hypothetical protein n=1 Tax=unclassified Streptomyces TaxID=2593676 RepID=UPI0036AA8C71
MALPPPRTAEIYYDGAWHPISVREADAVSITRGLSGAGTRAEPTAATMTLGNRGGELSVYDPTSPVYGKVGRNTPLRFTVAGGGPSLLLPAEQFARVTTPDHPGLTVTGDLDVRADIQPNDWTQSAALVSRAAVVGSQQAWVFCIGPYRSDSEVQRLELGWWPTGAEASLRYAVSTVPVPAQAGQRLAVRAVLDVNNGAGNCVVRFYIARRMGDRWSQLGDPVVLAGTTSLFDGTAGLEIGDSEIPYVPSGDFYSLGRLNGRVHGVQVYDGAALKVDVRPSVQGTAGAPSFQDNGNRVWTLSGAAALSNVHTRIEGEVPAWPPERHISGGDSVVKVTPAGILRRLGTGRKPLQSALRRAILAAGPIECWPLTDGPEAAAGAPLIGTNALLVQASANTKLSWGKGQIAEWIEPVLQADTGGASRLDAKCPASSTAANSWAVDWVRTGAGTDPGPELYHFVDSGTEGNQWVWTVEVDPANARVRVAPSNAGTAEGPDYVYIPAADLFDGRPHHLRLAVENIAGLAYWGLFIDGVQRGADSWTVPTTQLAYVATIFVMNLLDGAAPVSVGYLTYWGADRPPAADMYQAMLGHTGEPAAERILRVSAEQGITASCDGTPDVSEPLGAQEMDAYLDILETASNADLGLLLDRRDARALLYRTRTSLYTQAPAITLAYDAGVISGLRPADADRLIRNEVTAKRDGGSEHTAVLPEGPLSVQDPPAGVGRYDEGVTLSLAADDQTLGQAWWRLHLGTVDGLRYPRVTIDLANPRVAPLLADILTADVGDLLRLTGLPREYGPDDVDLLIRGYTEDIGPERWAITFVCDPGRPWAIGVADDPVYGRADTAGCQLGATVAPADTSLVLVTTQGPPWIRTATHPGEFPFDLTMGGERIRVTALAAGLADSFARTVASGWGTADAGGAWAQAGGTASDYSVSSGAGVHTLTTVNVSRRTTVAAAYRDVAMSVSLSPSAVATGGSIFGGLVARVVDVDSLYYARVEFTPAGTVILALRERAAGVESTLATVTTPYTYTAGAALRLRFEVRGSTLRARVWPAADIEPGVWHVTATDTTLTVAGSVGCRSILATGNTNTAPTVRYDDLLMDTPQRATVVRAVNGVAKSHTAGSAVQLFQPMIVAL